MANIKGVVVKDSKEKISLSTDKGLFDIVFKSQYDLKGVKKVSFVNIHEIKNIFKTSFEFREDSFVSFYPGLLVEPEEIDLDTFSSLFLLLSGEPIKASYEGDLFFAIRGIKKSEKFDSIANKLPKDVKAKFSFKPYVYDTNFGFFVKDALFFGKFPVVFEGNNTKGMVQALTSKLDNYLVLKEEGTFDEKTISQIEKKKIINKRNEYVFALYHFFNFLESNLNEDSPHFSNFKFVLDNKGIFKEPIESFLKEVRDTRKHIRKKLEEHLDNLEGLRILNAKEEGFEIVGAIKDNEVNLKKGNPVIVIEKPPFNMRVFGLIKSIDFKSISIETDFTLATPELVVPLKTVERSVKGIVKLSESKTPLKEFLLNKVKLPEIDENKSPIELLNSSPVVAIIKGDFGTGKKYLIGEFFTKNTDKKILVFSKKLYYSLKESFHKLVTEDINNLNGTYDFIFYFDREINLETMLNLASFTDNLIILTYPSVSVPFENEIEENRIKTLKEVYGFDKHIHHFVSKFCKLESISTIDVDEIKVLNKDNVDKAFIPIINPEKVVQIVSVKGKSEFEKNLINRIEAQFTVEAVTQFLKSGVERSSIEVIVPYERQKAYIIELLKSNQIEGVEVREVYEAAQKPIVIINIVNEVTLPQVFKDKFNLAFAVTRAHSKVIIVGNQTIFKKESPFSELKV